MRVTRRQVRRTLGIFASLTGGFGGGIIGVGTGMLLQHKHPVLALAMVGFGTAMIVAYALAIFLTSPRRNR